METELFRCKFRPTGNFHRIGRLPAVKAAEASREKESSSVQVQVGHPPVQVMRKPRTMHASRARRKHATSNSLPSFLLLLLNCGKVADSCSSSSGANAGIAGQFVGLGEVRWHQQEGQGQPLLTFSDEFHHPARRSDFHLPIVRSTGTPLTVYVKAKKSGRMLHIT